MGMKHTEDAIALQAIEFWSTVCEVEAELAWELSEVGIVFRSPYHTSAHQRKSAGERIR